MQHVEWLSRQLPETPDNVADYGEAEQAIFLREGISTLCQCGIERERILAFRAGNYGANNATWRAMRTCGLHLSSNMNLWALGGDCRINWEGEPIDLFDTGAGVHELPIANFRDADGLHRPLEITAVSASESKWFLRSAKEMQMAHAAIIPCIPGSSFTWTIRCAGEAGGTG